MTSPAEAVTRPAQVQANGDGAAAAPALAERTFDYAGYRVRVASREPSHLEWLAEFMRPQFDVREDGDEADGRIVLVDDTGMYDELLQSFEGCDSREEQCFAFADQVIRLPRFAHPTGDLFHEDMAGVLYLQRRPGAPVEVITRARSLTARIPLMRVVREMTMGHWQRAGAAVLHASAFACHGRGVIVAGDSGAGKTSLLIHALSAEGTRFLANDRVLVRGAGASPPARGVRGRRSTAGIRSGERPMLRGMPTIVTIRPRTLELFPAVANRILGSSHHYRFTITESVERGQPIRPWEDGRLGLAPAQFCAGVETLPLREARAWAVVFPRITGEPGGIDVRPLSPDVAAAELAGGFFGRTPPGAPSPPAWSSVGFYRDPEATARLALEIAQQLRCFECRIGLDAYEGPAGAKAWIEEVLA